MGVFFFVSGCLLHLTYIRYVVAAAVLGQGTSQMVWTRCVERVCGILQFQSDKRIPPPTVFCTFRYTHTVRTRATSNDSVAWHISSHSRIFQRAGTVDREEGKGGCSFWAYDRQAALPQRDFSWEGGAFRGAPIIVQLPTLPYGKQGQITLIMIFACCYALLLLLDVVLRCKSLSILMDGPGSMPDESIDAQQPGIVSQLQVPKAVTVERNSRS